MDNSQVNNHVLGTDMYVSLEWRDFIHQIQSLIQPVEDTMAQSLNSQSQFPPHHYEADTQGQIEEFGV